MEDHKFKVSLDYIARPFQKQGEKWAEGMKGRKKEREGKMDGSREKKRENKTKVNANYKRER